MGDHGSKRWEAIRFREAEDGPAETGWGLGRDTRHLEDSMYGGTQHSEEKQARSPSFKLTQTTRSASRGLSFLRSPRRNPAVSRAPS